MMRKSKEFLFVVFSAFLFFLLAQEQDPTYKISGIVLDFFSGKEVGSGNVSAIVVETGERNISFFSGNRFFINLNSSLNHTQNRFKIGILINTSNKTGYAQLKVGIGAQAPQTQACSVKKYYFKGLAIDGEGKLVENGKIRVSVEGYSNSTQFLNGTWEIEIWPCLISGEVYNFKFLIEGDGKTGFFSINQLAR